MIHVFLLCVVKDDGVKGMMIHVLLILSSTGHYFLAAIKVEKSLLKWRLNLNLVRITSTPYYANSVLLICRIYYERNPEPAFYKLLFLAALHLQPLYSLQLKDLWTKTR